MRKFTSKDLLPARTGPEQQASNECHTKPFQLAIDFFRLNVGRGRAPAQAALPVAVQDADSSNTID